MTRFFFLKAWLSGTAVVTGLVGMATERRWLVWTAVSLLAVAFTLRFAERGTGTDNP